MCGFVVTVSKKSSLNNKVGRDTLLRGIDYYTSESYLYDGLLLKIEFCQLSISTPAGRQPLQSDSLVLVLNGEIYNYQMFADRLQIASNEFSDTQIFFQHIQRFGLTETIKLTNGMYAGFLFNKVTGVCHIFTDHIGKKPLLIWNSEDGWHVGTGLDTNFVDSETRNVEAVSPGVWHFNLRTGNVSSEYCHELNSNSTLSLLDLLTDSVSLRIPKNIPYAVALSGGLDSSIIASIIETSLCQNAKYYVVAESYPSLVLELLDHLNICDSRVVLVNRPTKDELNQLIFEACRITKSYNPSIISNGVATLLLCQAVQADGIRVMLSGEGADEFFCGYQGMYKKGKDPSKMRNTLVNDLYFTELRRLDLISASCSVEARCPFLDHRITKFAMAKEASELCNSDESVGKKVLRKEFSGLLPDSIIKAPKEPFDITTGLQKIVIEHLCKTGGTERSALKLILEQTLNKSSIINQPYFSHYPAFDEMIESRALKYTVGEIS